MSSMEQSLRDAGAECVGGDLILKREVVGNYRNGQFVVTVAGAAVLEELAKKKTDEITAIARDSLKSDDIDIGDVQGLDLGMEAPRRRRGRNAE